MEKKNLVIFHLESVSKMIFENNSDLFNNLNRFKKECTNYNNYFSSSTSTYMVMSDLIYGDCTVFEKSMDYSTLIKTDNSKDNLFQELSKQGYFIEIIAPPYLPESEKKRFIDVFGDTNKYFYADSYAEFREEILKAIQKNKYAIYIADYISHIGYSEYRKSPHGWSESWKDGYRMLDRMFGVLIDGLRNSGKLNNTIIVAYGDHGDDFYTHKFNGGFTHAIEPYTCLTKTPLYIYKRGKYENVNDLVSTLDIREMVLRDLSDDAKVLKKRSDAYSRNLYVGQNGNKRRLNKSYSVTDGRYILLVSMKGLELYNIKIDPNNSFNILNFFYLEHKNLKVIRNFNLISSPHLDSFRKNGFSEEVIGVYDDLHSKLASFVGCLYQSADLGNDIKELSLYKINYTSYYASYKIILNYLDVIINKLKFKN